MDDRNLAEGLLGDRQTNQRAELTAILRALKICPINRSTHIFSDSNYSINCVTQWFQKWQKNDWVTAGGNKVENKDIIKDILEITGLREQAGVRTKFEWVKGHGSNEGNVEADKLAVAGAEKAKRDAIAAVAAERGGDQKVEL
jgi:ribonuclease HI